MEESKILGLSLTPDLNVAGSAMADKALGVMQDLIVLVEVSSPKSDVVQCHPLMSSLACLQKHDHSLRRCLSGCLLVHWKTASAHTHSAGPE